MPQVESKADLTPMIDVTFLLLIFFLVTLKFKSLEGQLDASLPKDMGCGFGETVEKLNILILATHADAKERNVRYEAGNQSCATLGELKALLVRQDRERTPVTIDPRAGVIHQEVMQVLDLLLAERFQKIHFAGTFEND